MALLKNRESIDILQNHLKELVLNEDFENAKIFSEIIVKMKSLNKELEIENEKILREKRKNKIAEIFNDKKKKK